mmetsp:Transcript_12154/g.15744  ORF Transcript_12154/g.15744 Transcript_12154/m.15744 type:complete len:158 (+) Transcript_12154:49-522(+)
MQMEQSASGKKKLDQLFVFHSVVAVFIGAFAILFPNLFYYFFHSDGIVHPRHEAGCTHMVSVIIRAYGCLIFIQGWIVWNARKVDDGRIRKTFVQAYFVCFVLTFMSLLRAQLTEDTLFNFFNWLNIVMFLFLAILYGYFIFFEKISVFEGLDKSTS